MHNDKGQVTDWLEQIVKEPDEWILFFSSSEVKMLAEDALELLKEQPKTKPMIHNSSADVWYYVCNDCNYPISPGDNYCGKCGKQIIWGNKSQ